MGHFKCSLYYADFQKIPCQPARCMLKSFWRHSSKFILYPLPFLPPFFFPSPSSPLLACHTNQVYTDTVRMPTHEILTACREFYIARFLFIFNYVSTGCGTFICVSSGRLLPYQPFFFMFQMISINPLCTCMQPSSPLTSFLCKWKQDKFVYLYLPHPGYMILDVMRCLLPYEAVIILYEQEKTKYSALNNIWVAIKMPAWKVKPELTVINHESNQKPPSIGIPEHE